MKLKDIAEKLGVLDTQIRKWKSTDKWDKELKGTLPIKKRNVTNQNKDIKKEPKLAAVTELENAELTDKQRLFCVIYSKCLNATKAYQKVYKCSYETAMVNGCLSLRNAKISEQIEKLTAIELNKEFIKRSLYQKWIDIAFADINDFMEFGQKEMPMLNPITGEPLLDEKGNPQTFTVDYAHFKENSEVDGTLISEVSKGKDGAKLKLQDKIKAMQWLSDRLDLLPSETQEKLKLEEEKVKLTREKLQIEKVKLSGENGETNNEGIQEFIKATTMKESEIKELFKDDENVEEKED